jgi:hypothetical protein
MRWHIVKFIRIKLGKHSGNNTQVIKMQRLFQLKCKRMLFKYIQHIKNET